MSSSDTILVTGGAGFIGSHLVRRLLKDGHDVSVITKASTDLWRLKDCLPEVRQFTADFQNAEELSSVINKIQPRGIFHLASSNIQSGRTAGDEEVVAVNIMGTVNLLKSLEKNGFDFFISTGSFMECGRQDHPIRESDLCEPTELYSITKLASTLYGQSVARTSGLPILALRIFTPYGPALQSGRLIYEVITRALKNEEIKLTSPTVVRDFIFVDDIVELCLESMVMAKKYSGEIFNAGTGAATSLQEVVNYVLKTTGSNSKVNWGAFHNVAYDSDKWQADMAKTFKHFSWRPNHTIELGLQKTIEWFKNNLSLIKN